MSTRGGLRVIAGIHMSSALFRRELPVSARPCLSTGRLRSLLSPGRRSSSSKACIQVIICEVALTLAFSCVSVAVDKFMHAAMDVVDFYNIVHVKNAGNMFLGCLLLSTRMQSSWRAYLSRSAHLLKVCGVVLICLQRRRAA